MSGSPNSKRCRFSPSPISILDSIFTDESVEQAINWSESHTEELTGQTHDLHVDTDLQTKERQKRAHVKPVDGSEKVRHFRLPLLSDNPECNKDTRVRDSLCDIVNATLSHTAALSIMKRLKESFTLQSVLTHTDCEMKYLISELRKLSKINKLSSICPLFKEATVNLNSVILKSQIDVYSHSFIRCTEQFNLCTQPLNTVGSYGLKTLLDNCDNYPTYLFTNKMRNQVLTIISCISQIFQAIPEARELVFLDETSDQATSPSPYKELEFSLIPVGDQSSTIFDGIRCTNHFEEYKIPLNNSRESCIDTLSLFERGMCLESQQYCFTVQDLINQIKSVLVHPQMNYDVIVACLNLFSSINIHNPGHGPECMRNLLRDGELNVIFNMHDITQIAVMRFYSTIPFTDYFVPYFSEKLFKRIMNFIVFQSTDKIVLELKLKLLSLLANSVRYHNLKFGTAYLSIISDLSLNILSSYSFCDKYKTRNVSQNLLLQIELVGSFLYHEYPTKSNRRNKILRDLALKSTTLLKVIDNVTAAQSLLIFDNFQIHKDLVL